MHAPRFRVLAALAVLLAMAMRVEAQTTYDVLLKGGHVIDPRNGIDGVMDVAVAGGKIAAVRAGIDPGTAKQVVDVGGLYVTPGLIDIHVHVFATTGVQGAWAGDSSVQPDAFSFRTGVTTMVDAGSSGLAQLRGLPAHGDRPRQHARTRDDQYRRLRHDDRRARAERPRHGREGRRGDGQEA